MSFTLFGKTPLFKKPFFIIRPYLPPKKDINKILSKLYATRYLTNNGYYVQKFEEKLQEYIGVKHIILLSSGTIALQLVIRSLEIKKETIMPSFTFVATAHSAKWEGVVPVFSDIEKDYFTINPSKIETLINDKTQAIIAVHLFGNPCDIEILQSLCSRYKLKLIFDAAQALGSVYKNKRVGAFGDAEVFSLHATKIINALEGGFVATNNTVLYDKIKLMRNFSSVPAGM